MSSPSATDHGGSLSTYHCSSACISSGQSLATLAACSSFTCDDVRDVALLSNLKVGSSFPLVSSNAQRFVCTLTRTASSVACQQVAGPSHAPSAKRSTFASCNRSCMSSLCAPHTRNFRGSARSIELADSARDFLQVAVVAVARVPMRRSFLRP